MALLFYKEGAIYRFVDYLIHVDTNKDGVF
jgi:hypothetical protein